METSSKYEKDQNVAWARVPEAWKLFGARCFLDRKSEFYDHATVRAASSKGPATAFRPQPRSNDSHDENAKITDSRHVENGNTGANPAIATPAHRSAPMINSPKNRAGVRENPDVVKAKGIKDPARRRL